jgi:hypothetical protein
MAQLTHDDRLRAIHNELHALRLDLLRKHEAEVVGDWHDVDDLEATITGLRWTYEDDVLMVVTYTHPFTGKVTETEEHMG